MITLQIFLLINVNLFLTILARFVENSNKIAESDEAQIEEVYILYYSLT